ncbi:glycosyltransferase family 4 protein [Phenylobacterium soli]|uniref:glycosyltransferase family 4 protein n=1 Tax=Phenylobacterium soli TaxID=2170551 RepID=UPI001403F3B7|nr:glycosyltransferase family 4 protein [Phenylobacterium soli]
MRVLFSDLTLPYLLKDAEYPVGGWAVQLRQLAIALREAGHEVGVLTWAGANAFVGPQSEVQLLETYDRNRGIRKLRFFYYFLPSMIAAARRFRPDVVVQSCASTETGTMAFIASLLGVPFVHRIAADTDADGQYVTRLKQHERVAFQFGMRRAKLVICQNSYQSENIAISFPKKGRLLLHNSILVPPGIGDINPRGARSYVAWLNVFRRQKNLPLLIKIAAALPAVKFRVAGSAMPQHMDEEMRANIAALEALPNVELVGYLTRDRVPEFLAGAIALLSTSDFEGFSNTYLEALLAGTPIVTRSIVDPDSIVRRNALGGVADSGDELAGELAKVVGLPPARFDQLAMRCRDYVLANHRPSAAVEKLVAAFQQVAG